jgi:hypothetical protein
MLLQMKKPFRARVNLPEFPALTRQSPSTIALRLPAR